MPLQVITKIHPDITEGQNKVFPDNQPVSKEALMRAAQPSFEVIGTLDDNQISIVDVTGVPDYSSNTNPPPTTP